MLIEPSCQASHKGLTGHRAAGKLLLTTSHSAAGLRPHTATSSRGNTARCAAGTPLSEEQPLAMQMGAAGEASISEKRHQRALAA